KQSADVWYLLPPPPTYTPFPYTTLFRSKINRLDFVPGQADPGIMKPRPFHGRMLPGLALAGAVSLGALALERIETYATGRPWLEDRKSTRLNSSHVENSYAVFCLKKKQLQIGPWAAVPPTDAGRGQHLPSLHYTDPSAPYGSCHKPSMSADTQATSRRPDQPALSA